jgi:hypothetical protein
MKEFYFLELLVRCQRHRNELYQEQNKVRLYVWRKVLSRSLYEFLLIYFQSKIGFE